MYTVRSAALISHLRLQRVCVQHPLCVRHCLRGAPWSRDEAYEAPIAAPGPRQASSGQTVTEDGVLIVPWPSAKPVSGTRRRCRQPGPLLAELRPESLPARLRRDGVREADGGREACKPQSSAGGPHRTPLRLCFGGAPSEPGRGAEPHPGGPGRLSPPPESEQQVELPGHAGSSRTASAPDEARPRVPGGQCVRQSSAQPQLNALCPHGRRAQGGPVTSGGRFDSCMTWGNLGSLFLLRGVSIPFLAPGGFRWPTSEESGTSWAADGGGRVFGGPPGSGSWAA